MYECQKPKVSNGFRTEDMLSHIFIQLKGLTKCLKI